MTVSADRATSKNWTSPLLICTIWQFDSLGTQVPSPREVASADTRNMRVLAGFVGAEEEQHRVAARSA